MERRTKRGRKLQYHTQPLGCCAAQSSQSHVKAATRTQISMFTAWSELNQPDSGLKWLDKQEVLTRDDVLGVESRSICDSETQWSQSNFSNRQRNKTCRFTAIDSHGDCPLLLCVLGNRSRISVAPFGENEARGNKREIFPPAVTFWIVQELCAKLVEDNVWWHSLSHILHPASMQSGCILITPLQADNSLLWINVLISASSNTSQLMTLI